MATVKFSSSVCGGNFQLPLLDESGIDDDGLKVPVLAVWMVCIIVFVDSLGGSISAPVLPFYAQEFNASGGAVGLLFSAFSLAQVVFLPILGGLSDRVGRRTVLIVSLFGAALGAFMQGFAPNIAVFTAARVISGAFGAVGSTANVYVSDVTSEGSTRTLFLGYLMSSNGLAFAFGPGLGGGLSKLGMNIPILVDGALSLIAGILCSYYLPESPTWVKHQQDEAQRSLSRGLSTRTTGIRSFTLSVWTICATEFLRGFSFSAIFAVYGLFALKIYGLTSLHIGFTVCVGALTLICTNIWISPRLHKGCGEVGCAGLGLFLIGAGELVLAYAPCLSLSLLGVWTTYMGQAMAGCTIAAITSCLATDENRGAVMSMQQMAQAAGRVVGPLCLCYLFAIHPTYPFAVAAASSMIGIGFLAYLRNPFRRRTSSFTDVVPLSTPPDWPDEEYTDDDVQELGSFLCDLLTKRHYRWRQPGDKEALKRVLAVYFPPISADGDGDMHNVLAMRKRIAEGMDAHAIGECTAQSLGELVRSPAVHTSHHRRRYSK